MKRYTFSAETTEAQKRTLCILLETFLIFGDVEYTTKNVILRGKNTSVELSIEIKQPDRFFHYKVSSNGSINKVTERDVIGSCINELS